MDEPARSLKVTTRVRIPLGLHRDLDPVFRTRREVDTLGRASEMIQAPSPRISDRLVGFRV